MQNFAKYNTVNSTEFSEGILTLLCKNLPLDKKIKIFVFKSRRFTGEHSPHAGFIHIHSVSLPPREFRVSEPELGYLAGAGAVTVARLRIRIGLHLKYLFNNSRKLYGT